MEQDTCDCCETKMKHSRVASTYLFVCDDCRDWGMKQLGTTATKLQIGIAEPKDEMPDCIWRGAEYPFCSNY